MSLYFDNSSIFNIDVKGTSSTTVMTTYRRNGLHFMNFLSKECLAATGGRVFFPEV